VKLPRASGQDRRNLDYRYFQPGSAPLLKEDATSTKKKTYGEEETEIASLNISLCAAAELVPVKGEGVELQGTRSSFV